MLKVEEWLLKSLAAAEKGTRWGTIWDTDNILGY